MCFFDVFVGEGEQDLLFLHHLDPSSQPTVLEAEFSWDMMHEIYWGVQYNARKMTVLL